MTPRTENARPTIYTEATGVDHFADPPKRRVGCLLLVRSSVVIEEAEVLMCFKEPTREKRQPWYHPGGAAERNENEQVAAARVAYAKLGVAFTTGRPLVHHHMYDEEHTNPTGGTSFSYEGGNWVFDGGVMSKETVFTFGAGVTGARWFKREELKEHLAPFTAWRTLEALECLESGGMKMLHGHPDWA